MIINELNKVFKKGNAEFVIGEKVKINESSDYFGFEGIIKEIKIGDDREVFNEGEEIEISVDLIEPEDEEIKKQITKRFSNIFEHEIDMDDIPLEKVNFPTSELNHI